MKTFIIIVIGLLVLNLLIAGVGFFVKVLKSKFLKSVEFTVSLNVGSKPGNQYYYLNLQTPFYDEKKNFYLGLSIPIQISFVPIETIPLALKEILKDKYLIQIEWDNSEPPQMPELVADLKERKAIIGDGIFVYTPEAINSGGLDCAFTDGRDVLFISSNQIGNDKLQAFKEKKAEWQKMSNFDNIVAQREFFNTDGDIVKALDVWQIILKDKEYMSKAINIIFQRCGEKALHKAGLHNVTFSKDTDFSKYIFSNPKGSTDTVRISVKENKVIFRGKSFKEELLLGEIK